ncbi:alpha/beta hydrolase [Spongiibacter sp. KMU-166]|uniref:Alpha/beta hydrolase n=1 Tax=Spongiibacter thalassae TaxID=2721624 RepID=A0ABX1GGH8_9GAMM|nr:alpha/beta hydrolase [Spongiibacter thalassae]NKI17648.1 alpha/beta hydrolase [Spongiibacter thalassae]
MLNRLISHLWGTLKLLGLLFVMFSITGCALRAVNWLSHAGDTRAVHNLSYGPHARQKMDLYRPTQGENLPVVLFIHGGYWSSGEREEYRFVGETLAQQGYLAAIISYRLYPEVVFPAFIEDAAAATAHLRQIASHHGGDPQQLYLAGHSAGAHSALSLSLDPRYLAPYNGTPNNWIKGVIGLSGPYDFLPPKAAKVAAIFASPENYHDGNPINFATSSAPPALLIHSSNDRTVGAFNSERLARELREHHNPVELVLLPGNHATPLLAFSGFKRDNSEVLAAINRFISGVFANQHANAEAMAD